MKPCSIYRWRHKPGKAPSPPAQSHTEDYKLNFSPLPKAFELQRGDTKDWQCVTPSIMTSGQLRNKTATHPAKTGLISLVYKEPLPIDGKMPKTQYLKMGEV